MLVYVQNSFLKYFCLPLIVAVALIVLYPRLLGLPPLVDLTVAGLGT